MSSHEMASQIMAVQIEIPTTARLSEYLDPDSSRVLGAMEMVTRKFDQVLGVFFFFFCLIGTMKSCFRVQFGEVGNLVRGCLVANIEWDHV